MYFPYLRGRQYELLALRELVSQQLLGAHIVPIVEPVKLSATLINTMDAFVDKKQPLAVLRNPTVGTFTVDWNATQERTRAAVYRKRFEELYDSPIIVKAIGMAPGVESLVSNWAKKGTNKKDLLVVCTDRNELSLYDSLFSFDIPQYTLMPDEGAFRRRIHNHRVLLDDKFPRKKRNADYQEEEDEFFSDDHLYYKDDGFIGFSDYSIIGKEYQDAGFAPYAVAIHVVYFDTQKTLRIRHFVSDSNEDITNPAMKFYEAASKLKKWCSQSDQVPLTKGLKELLSYQERQSYPGLGTVKKLTLMHHLELMGRYLEKV